MEGMQGLRTQHLIDPEICIRCNTCESRCPTGAISHNQMNYVVDADVCNFCMACVGPCPTGAIDNWLRVGLPFPLEAQLAWPSLPKPPAGNLSAAVVDAFDPEVLAILETTHRAMRGAARAPASASKPRINLFTRANPALARITGNLRLTAEHVESDIHYIILDFGNAHFPFLEGQSIGVLPPGADADGKPHAVRLYSIASARDGERPNTNNLALTVKRITKRVDGTPFHGIASNWLCDLKVDDTIEVTGPFGATFLMPEEPDAHVLMICTGTGTSPFRGFSHRRRRTNPTGRGKYYMFFGARSPEELPYFGPLQSVPLWQLDRELVFSRLPGQPKEYVQDRLRQRADKVGAMLAHDNCYIYICGGVGLEQGVEAALAEIASAYAIDWPARRETLRQAGRFHIETY